jgi:hypothetical protein
VDTTRYCKTSGIGILIIFAIVMMSSQENAFGLIWDENKKLTWDDFQGEKKYFSYRHGAMTFSDLSLEYSWKYSETDDCNYEFDKISTTAVFDKKASYVRSWVLEDNRQSAWILNHEQRHFDITEIHARIFNQQAATELLGEKFSCPSGIFGSDYQKSKINSLIKNQVHDIFDMRNMRLDIQQDNYDDDVEHSEDYENQTQWNKKIDSQLKTLKEKAQKQKLIDQVNHSKENKNQRPTNEIDFDYFKGYPELVKVFDDENAFYTVSGYVSDEIYTRGFPLELFVKYPDSSIKKSQIAVTSEQYFEFPLMFDSESEKGEYKIILHYKGIEVYSEHIVVGGSVNEIESIRNNSITIESDCIPIPEQECTPYQQIMRGETGTYLITGSFANNSLMPATMTIKYPSGKQDSFSVPSKLITEYKKFYEYSLPFTWESERGKYTISVYSPQHLYIQKIVLNVGPMETQVKTTQLLKLQEDKRKNVFEIMQANLDECNYFGPCDEKPDEAEIIQNIKPNSPKKTTIHTQLAGFDRLFIHVDMEPVSDYYKSRPYSLELLCFPYNNEIASALQTLLKNEPTYLELIAYHAQTIKCQGDNSDLRIKFNGQPTIMIEKNILLDLGVDWFTGLIGHEACHSKQYFDYLKDNPQYASVPSHIYKGNLPHEECNSFQQKVHSATLSIR